MRTTRLVIIGFLVIGANGSNAADCRSLFQQVFEPEDAGALGHIMQFARKPYTERSEAENVVIRSYKTRIGPPRKVELPTLGLTVDETKMSHPKQAEYLNAALDLKSGDTVIIGGRSFVLGRFLGAGSMTHVFQLGSDPEKAIRIPFPAWGSIQEAYRYMLEFGDIRYDLKQLNPIKVYEIESEGRFALVEFVPIRITGDVFATRNAPIITALREARHQQWYKDTMTLEEAFEEFGKRYSLLLGQPPEEISQIAMDFASLVDTSRYGATEEARAYQQFGLDDRTGLWRHLDM